METLTALEIAHDLAAFGIEVEIVEEFAPAVYTGAQVGAAIARLRMLPAKQKQVKKNSLQAKRDRVHELATARRINVKELIANFNNLGLNVDFRKPFGVEMVLDHLEYIYSRYGHRNY